MDNERYELEKEYSIVDKKLEKEKSKRNIIMILLCSILCGFVFSLLIDENILSLIVMSIIFGCILYFIVMFAFAFVTDSFTSITYLQNRKSALEAKLKTIQNDE